MSGKNKYECIIPSRLPGLNEFIEACRSNKYGANKLKIEAQQICILGLRQLPKKTFKNVFIHFHWIEENKRRDKDNIAFAKKFIFDAMQCMGLLANDGWEQVSGFDDAFSVDKGKSRIVVTIEEEED